MAVQTDDPRARYLVSELSREIRGRHRGVDTERVKWLRGELARRYPKHEVRTSPDGFVSLVYRDIP